MSFPPKLGKEQKQDYRREKRRKKERPTNNSGNITVTIPANATQGVVVQPFSLPLFTPQQPAVNNNNNNAGRYQQRNQRNSPYRSQYQHQHHDNEGRKQGVKQKSPPSGNYVPVPKKKRGPEGERDKYWAVIYPYKDIDNIRGNVIQGTYNSLYREVSRVWWTDWETKEEAETALSKEMIRRKEQTSMDLISKSPPPRPSKSTPIQVSKQPDLRQILEENRKFNRVRPDLPATFIINPAKELENLRKSTPVVTNNFDCLDVEMPPRISSSDKDVGEVIKSTSDCYFSLYQSQKFFKPVFKSNLRLFTPAYLSYHAQTIFPGLGYLFKSVINTEGCIALMNAAFDLSSTRRSDNIRGNFNDGWQIKNYKRTRMAVWIFDFKRQELMKEVVKEGLKSIAVQYYNSTMDFKPNAMHIFLSFVGATLVPHKHPNDPFPVVSILSVGGPVVFSLKKATTERDKTQGIWETERCVFLESGDMLIIDGKRLKHGFVQLTGKTFNDELSRKEFPGPYRCSFCCRYAENISTFFHGGRDQHDPLYEMEDMTVLQQKYKKKYVRKDYF